MMETNRIFIQCRQRSRCSVWGYMELPNRKPTRLANYDYSNQNYYFITICTYNKLKLFVDVNELDKIAEIELMNIPNHFEDGCLY